MSKQLGINPEMDKLALENGLGHWSCVSPKNSSMWVRSDGYSYYCENLSSGSDNAIALDNISLLKYVDYASPIGKDWQQQTTDLPEKIIVSKGCHYCLFGNDGFYCRLNVDVYIEQNIEHESRNHECPLLTHTIKVVKGEDV